MATSTKGVSDWPIAVSIARAAKLTSLSKATLRRYAKTGRSSGRAVRSEDRYPHYLSRRLLTGGDSGLKRNGRERSPAPSTGKA